jgi:thymidylate kinase
VNHKLLPLIVIEGADGAGTTTQAKTLVDKLNSEAERALSAIRHDNTKVLGFSVQPQPIAMSMQRDKPLALLTRQPSDGPIGQQIRAILTGRDRPLSSASAFQLMFTADRLDHVSRVVGPALNDDVIVVSDRYDMSTAVYLAASEPRYRCPVDGCGWTGDEWPMGSSIAKYMPSPQPVVHDHEPDDREALLLKQAFAWNEMAPRPLVTIVLAVSAEVAAERRALRGGKAELFEQAEFQRRVCRLYSNAHDTYLRGNALESREQRWRPIDLGSPVVKINGEASEGQVAAAVFDAANAALRGLHAHRQRISDWKSGLAR